MQPSNLRSVFIYGLTGIVLLGAIVLGVQFARNRSASITNPEPTVAANDQNGNTNAPSTPSTTEPSKSPTGSTDKEKPKVAAKPKTTEKPKVAATGTGHDDETGTMGTHTDTPNRVPATGPEELAITTLAVSALAFSGLVYIRSRRDYRNSALAN